MANMNGFDANQHQPQDFTPIPTGWHVACATESEWKDTKNGRGRYMQFVFEIGDGAHKGRKLWERLNLENQNQTAVDIANRTLSAFCRAAGVLQPQDSADLHYKYVEVLVKHEEYNGETKARIAGYRPVDSGRQQPASAPAQQQPQPSQVPQQQKPTHAWMNG